MAKHVSDLVTPCVLVYESIAQRNANTMLKRAETLGVKIRPHVKTHKTIEGALMQTGGRASGIVVSTLAEATFFQENGFTDILYAVALGLDKLPAIIALFKQDPTFQVLVDNTTAIESLCCRLDAAKYSQPMQVWLKVDCGYGRAGVRDPTQLVHLAKTVDGCKQLQLKGCYTHGGMAYHASTVASVQEASIKERDGVVRGATAIRASGLDVSEVAVGSTPTCSHPPPDGLDGITEIHPGNYFFYDAMQVRISSCKLSDIAVTIQTRVIGTYPDRNEFLIDAGFTALSAQGADTGYGMIKGFEDTLRIKSLSQESGVVCMVNADEPMDFQRFSLGALVEIYPHHSCAACCMHAIYNVVDDEGNVTATWKPTRCWTATDH
eukprot:m.60531 g.60531  ORF g.60531 m.60531 type:complete len:379 (-) comp11821_c0_seq1:98-1234(-)